MDTFITYFLYFIIYSFLGYICEVIYVGIITKHIGDRGFLFGPIVPIYGFGALLIIVSLNWAYNYWYLVIILGFLITTALEYLVSFFMELIFKRRWWDYSDRKFNINARINLATGIKFGLGSIFLLKILNPILFKLFDTIPKNTLITISLILTFIIALDTIISSYIIAKLKVDTKKYFKRDATEDIKEKVRESLKKYKLFYSRILHAFPNLSLDNKKFERIKKIIRRKNRT